MLTVTDGVCQRDCRGLTRRSLLQIGGLSLGGLSLPGLLAARASAAAAGQPVTDKSVVLLFLQGGPSHIELFDPKMTAPLEIRSTTGEVATALPGVTFGGTFPRLAQLAQRLAVVRSYASGNSGHSYTSVVSGGNPTGASMGAIYARVAGANHPQTGMPTHTLIVPEAIQPDLKLQSNFETNALPGLATAGELGQAYAAFNPIGGGELKKNMELKIPRDRLADRQRLLAGLDQIKRRLDVGNAYAGLDRYQQQAFDVILGGVADAFDLSQEDPRTIAKYDTSGVFRMADLNKYNDMRRSSNLLGRQLLLARRLCEAGCGFVTVADAGWDMHGNNNSLPRLTGIEPLGRQVDHAVAAFLEDVRDRGLSDKILLVITGEMGRTPRINKRGGRDHYGNLTSLVLAGGGLQMGQVIGQSDRTASLPATDRYSPQNLLATVMHTLFDIGRLRVTRGVPREIQTVVNEAKPIAELF